MNELSTLVPPAWVTKRDGCLVPFEADKISRSLFAASESLGQPDAFLARELADGVVHFLTEESAGSIPATGQIAEVVVKIVRELGQPLLARAYEEFRQRRAEVGQTFLSAGRQECLPHSGRPATASELVLRFAADAPPREVLSACVRQYSLQAVFARDLAAAHNDGLLTLGGLDTPTELAGCVLAPFGPEDSATSVVPALEKARRFVAGFVVLDGPEHALVRAGRGDERDAARLASELELGLRLTGLHAIVNLNCAQPPSSADDLAGGPLFAGQRYSPRLETLTGLTDSLLNHLVRSPKGVARVRIDWHLTDRDFGSVGGQRERLARLGRLALEGAPLAFVFDRPKRPAGTLALAEGVNRAHPAVLMPVGLHLPRLAEQPGVAGDAERFVQKLGSLARLALSAGAQKRAYLRAHGSAADLNDGFLLDRARLMVTPVGLDHTVAQFTGRSLSAGGAGLDLGRRIVQRLREVLRQDGRLSQLETCVDGPSLSDDEASQVAGLTPWELNLPVKQQWRAAGILHAAAEHGTLVLVLPTDRAVPSEDVAAWLQTMWQQTEVVRVRFQRVVPEHRQLTIV
jgi:ATP cone domain